VHVGNARLNLRRFSTARARYSCGLAIVLFLLGSKGLQNAVAEGDTRTITMHHLHTGEDITITFKRDGRYDDAALEKLNWFLRDWRRSESTHMDPHLIDLVWEVQREVGAKDPIQVVCGYRSPQTNAMLRHRSAGVARFSQHMLGHAMDFFIPGVPLEHLREIGLRLQRGGVGFYPESGSPFVHMDTGGIRMWPRMTRDELARVFPDGRTVHIPTDGRPLAGYALALADIRKRGATPSENSLEAARTAGVDVGTMLASNEHPVNPFARLLGLAKDEDDEDDASSTSAAPVAAVAPTPPRHAVIAAIEHGAQIAEKATVKVAVKVADAASKAKLIRTASAAMLPPPPAPPAPPNDTAASAAPTANQIITSRGYWQGLPDGMIAAKPATRARRPADTANASSDSTGAISPWASPRNDRADPELALSYAEQPDRQTDAATPSLTAALPLPVPPAQTALALPAAPAPQIGTTIAVKRMADQAASTVLTASAKLASVVRNNAHLDNPWLRAVILSPSVHRFLTTVALGAHDFRTLAALMVKPSSSVMMTFSADPNAGLAHDHFSGSAIVFVSTVSYPTHTALLLR
jgi:uncharacterized protein YcbK (DUF882 family)